MYPAIKSSHRRISARLRSENAAFLGHPPTKDVPRHEFLMLCREFPNYKVSEYRIELFLPFEHPDLTSFLSECIRLGLTLPNDHFEVQQIEIIDYTKPSKGEISTSKYLECYMYESIIRTPFSATPEGQFRFNSSNYLKQSAKKLYGSFGDLSHIIAVGGAAKDTLEKSELVGLSFEPIHGCDGVEPLWILWSSLVLPPMDMNVVDNRGNRFQSCEVDYEHLTTECYLCDKYELLPRATYADLPFEFDVAITKERLTGRSKAYHRVIYSQKAKAVLEKIGMKLVCVPVTVNRSSV
jgi:hypothetical protein